MLPAWCEGTCISIVLVVLVDDVPRFCRTVSNAPTRMLPDEMLHNQTHTQKRVRPSWGVMHGTMILPDEVLPRRSFAPRGNPNPAAEGIFTTLIS